MSVVRKAIILGESPGDREAIAVVCRCVAGNVSFDTDSVHANGYNTVKKLILPTLHRIASDLLDADRLVVIVDGDNFPANPSSERSRLKELQSLVRKVPRLSSIPVSIGVAAPSIEAWLLHNRSGGSTEATWESELAGNENPSTRIKKLKRDFYGQNDVPTAVQHQKMVRRMQELMESNQLESMIESFPHGLGELVKELRLWAE